MLRSKLRAAALTAGLCIASALAAAGQTPTAAPRPQNTTSPEPPSAVVAKKAAAAPAAVVAELRELADWVTGRRGTISARVVDLGTGAVWAEASPEAALNPASNMKLITAAVALDRLGPTYVFSTGLYGQNVDGHVDPLVLRGHGDPSLETKDLWQLAQALHHLGVRSVGRVLVDQSRFDDQFVPPGFEQQPDEWAYFRAPVSAVAIARNTVEMHVLPTSPGQPARVWFEPPGIVQIEGQIETRKSRSGEAIRLALESRGPELWARIGGHVAAGLPRLRFSRRLDDPRRAPGLVLASVLGTLGVKVRGPVELGGADVKPRLVFHESEPLGELLHPMGKLSDNFYAETLLKVLGGEAGALPARSADGARVLMEWLSGKGVPTAGLRIENGSGLFDTNRVSAAALIRVLALVQQSPALYPEFLAQLAIGGVDGTLRSRFRRQPWRRQVRAKTGTLANAVGLSGYVLSSRGAAPAAFALLVNGLEGQAWAVRQRMDKVVAAVARAK